MAKTKKFSNFLTISFVFWANISTGLGDPLGCSDLSQIFFGSSPTGIEWDKVVAEIIITTFVFLRHPNPARAYTTLVVLVEFFMHITWVCKHSDYSSKVLITSHHIVPLNDSI